MLKLVAVVVRLVGTIDGNTDVFSLDLSELGELGTELGKVETSDFFIENLGKSVDINSLEVTTGNTDLS